MSIDLLSPSDFNMNLANQYLRTNTAPLDSKQSVNKVPGHLPSPTALHCCFQKLHGHVLCLLSREDALYGHVFCLLSREDVLGGHVFCYSLGKTVVRPGVLLTV